MQASLSADKLARIRDCIHACIQTCSRKELQSLLGMLNFGMRIITQGRSFISRLLTQLPIASNWFSGQTRFCSFIQFTHVGQVPSALELHYHVHPCSVRVIFSGYYRCCSHQRLCSILWHSLASRTMAGQSLAISRFEQTSALFKSYPIVSTEQVWGHLWRGNTVVFFPHKHQATSVKGRWHLCYSGPALLAINDGFDTHWLGLVALIVKSLSAYTQR